MNFRPRRRQDPEINITPLIDMVFLLLIFFMVSSTFTRESQVEVTLPQASAQTPDLPEVVIEVAIDRHGQWYLNGGLLPDTGVPTLVRALHAAVPKEGEQPPTLIISADAAATHQAVIDVMDAARQAGLNRISFPTRNRDD